MFNNYHAGNTTQNVKVNAVSGAILKNHPKSWFERIKLGSSRADLLLAEGGFRYSTYSEHKDRVGITVLQMVICGDMEVLAELVYTSDYEEKVGVLDGNK